MALASVDEKKPSEENESSDQMLEYLDPVIPNSNPWLNVSNDKSECIRYESKLNTREMFAYVTKIIDNYCKDNNVDNAKTLPFWDDLCMYSSLIWLPKKIKKKHNETTQITLSAWQKENPIIAQDWNLMDRKSGGYQRLSKAKDVVHVDICWRRTWFSKYGLNVDQKVYFWRGWWCNTDRGKEYIKQYTRILIDRLNLCYIAWAKVMNGKTDWLETNKIPIITFTRKAFRNGERDTRMFDEPKWVFICDKNDKRNDSNDSKYDKERGSTFDQSSGIRKSLRLAHNDTKLTDNEGKTSEKQLNKLQNIL